MTQTSDREQTPRPPDGGHRRDYQPRSKRYRITRALIIAVAAVVVVTLVLFVGGFLAVKTLTPVEPARVSLSLEAPDGGLMEGEQFSVSGTVSTGFERPVTLESRSASGSWTRLESVETDGRGGYSFLDIPALDADLRVVVPAIRHLGQRHPGVTSAVPAARVVPQRVSDFSMLPGIAQAGAETADAGAASLVGRATFSPARPGRAVVVQRRLPGGSWERVGREVQGDDGTVEFQVPQDAATPYQFRVVAQSYDGADTKASIAQASNRWRLDFDDQFTNGLDTSRWIIRGDVHDPASSRTCAKADPSMVVASDGALELSAERDTSLPAGSCSWENPSTGASGTEDYYLNSHIGTQGAYSFRYGVAAARVKFQEPQGMHGAFWLQDSGEAEGTVGAEIDTVEFFGKGFSKGGVASFIYPSAGEEVGGTQPDADAALTGPRDNWWDRYHVFSVEWTPEEYVFRIDGIETMRTSKALADRKVFVILSLLTSDWELKRMPESGAGTMSVDWVRVWQDTRLADLNR